MAINSYPFGAVTQALSNTQGILRDIADRKLKQEAIKNEQQNQLASLDLQRAQIEGQGRIGLADAQNRIGQQNLQEEQWNKNYLFQQNQFAEAQKQNELNRQLAQEQINENNRKLREYNESMREGTFGSFVKEKVKNLPPAKRDPILANLYYRLGDDRWDMLMYKGQAEQIYSGVISEAQNYQPRQTGGLQGARGGTGGMSSDYLTQFEETYLKPLRNVDTQYIPDTYKNNLIKLKGVLNQQGADLYIEELMQNGKPTGNIVASIVPLLAQAPNLEDLKRAALKIRPYLAITYAEPMDVQKRKAQEMEAFVLSAFPEAQWLMQEKRNASNLSQGLSGGISLDDNGRIIASGQSQPNIGGYSMGVGGSQTEKPASMTMQNPQMPQEDVESYWVQWSQNPRSSDGKKLAGSIKRPRTPEEYKMQNDAFREFILSPTVQKKYWDWRNGVGNEYAPPTIMEMYEGVKQILKEQEVAAQKSVEEYNRKQAELQRARGLSSRLY